MQKFLRSTFVAAVLLPLTFGSLAAETVPTVITADDVPAKFEALKAKAAPSVQDLRELTVMFFIEAASAPELSRKQLKTYVRTFEDLIDAADNDPEVHAIRAAFYGIQAREARSDMDALLLAKKGIEMLDNLVEEHPGNGGVLMQRGLSALYAPSFLGRDSVFVEDFTTLLSERFDLPPQQRGYVLYNLLQGYKKIGNTDAAKPVQSELQALAVSPWSEMGAEVSF